MKVYSNLENDLIQDDMGILEEPNHCTENELSRKVIGAAITVHKTLGPGLLESAYEICLLHELRKMNLRVENQVTLPISYDGKTLDAGYRIDLMVEGKLIIELKSVSEVSDIHLAQILTYLKLSNCKLGILINFNELKVINGIRRIVNKL